MATTEEREQARGQLHQALEHLLSSRDQDLVRSVDLGTQMDFSSGASSFTQLLQLYEDLAACPVEILSVKQLRVAKDHAATAAQIFQRVREFKAEQGSKERDNIVQEARDAYDTHLDQLAPILSYAYSKGTDFRALERQGREVASRMAVNAQETKNSANSLLDEARSILESIRDTAAQVGVAHHAANFENEAQEHAKDTTRWLRTTVGLSVGAVVFLVALFAWPLAPKDLSDLKSGRAIYEIASRVLVFSVLTYVILWASRNYMAHRHNVVVNKHRQNALRTFETFVKAAGDDKDVKNAVLLQASHSIFSAQPTGYLSREPMPAPPRNFVEVIQKAISPASDEPA